MRQFLLLTGVWTEVLKEQSVAALASGQGLQRECSGRSCAAADESPPTMTAAKNLPPALRTRPIHSLPSSSARGRCHITGKAGARVRA